MPPATATIWGQWYGSTSTTIAVMPIWTSWNYSLTTSTGSYSNNIVAVNTVWTNWNANLYNTASLYTTPRATPAEMERVNRQIEEDRVTRVAIKDRAEALLLSVLNEEQRAQYRRDNSFELIVGEKRYRIRRGRSGNVRLLEAGRERIAYCIHPSEYVPDEDTMAAQKLLLENDESEFLRIANATRLAA